MQREKPLQPGKWPDLKAARGWELSPFARSFGRAATTVCTPCGALACGHRQHGDGLDLNNAPGRARAGMAMVVLAGRFLWPQAAAGISPERRPGLAGQR